MTLAKLGLIDLLGLCGPLTDIRELAEAIKINRSLTELDMNVTNAGGQTLLQALKVNSTLTALNHLNWSLDGRMDSSIYDQIQERLSYNCSLVKQVSEKEKESKTSAASAVVQGSKPFDVNKAELDQIKRNEKQNEGSCTIA